ncbi:uncharacterized protein DUF1207 [Nitrosomonas aestuarii]|nr:uncharacterized protein DUF1207 [Nitrosomonas aestuarii]
MLLLNVTENHHVYYTRQKRKLENVQFLQKCKHVKRQAYVNCLVLTSNQKVAHSTLAVQKRRGSIRHAVRRFVLLTVALFWIPATSIAASPDDVYVAGYAAGSLKSKFGIELPSLVVSEGVISVSVEDLTIENRVEILQLLSEIPGVIAVEMLSAADQPAATASTDPAISPASNETATIASLATTRPVLFPTGLLPTGHLFKPLLADPRWAHFSAAYRNYVGNNLDGNHNGSVSFGETIPFYRANLGQTTIQWETGLQAAVFSDFNLGAESSDLINSDFIASAYASMRAGKFSAFSRIYHQSSHLGDEFLLRTQTELKRINLSYEGIDLRLSYELPHGFRVYGGGGGIFHKEPSTLKPWSVQYGVELRSPWRFDFAAARPIMAVDLKNYEQTNWSADVSARAGIQFENFQTFGRKLQFMLEYFNGNSPTGQFYIDKVEYLGIGAHYHY